jgi:hypothetical chaperone protein
MIVGMDFGTTNSGIAYQDEIGALHFVPIDKAGGNIARTALYLTNDRQVYIGRHAVDTYFAQNLNRPVKMGRVWVGEITLTFAELPSFVRDVYVDKDLYAPGRLFLSFKMALPLSNYVGTVVGSHFYFVEDIVALYLYIARQRAEAHLGREVTRIVLGRPVRYSFTPDEDQLARARMLKAAFQAGFDEVYFQYEPLAAAAHYESTIDRPQHILIFDFGGGTLDVSVVRVGDPAGRAVLANGGVPIAGDVFDQKLVRARLPRHFGEGSHYRRERNLMPVPSSFYEAFTNWQEMLTLQRPETLESLARIEQTAERPSQIRALRSLISTNYGLKMFDVVEAVKRQLSTGLRGTIRLSGEGFQVYEPVTRGEFEAIIRAEIRTIDAFLDDILAQSGLRADQIDVVIRTGGSSLIPAFVNMLETRFGPDKVRSLDTFSSVTAGLGIIGRQIERGEVELPVHRRADLDAGRMKTPERSWVGGDVPAIDFDTMKKFITLVEGEAEAEKSVGIIAQDVDHAVSAVVCSPERFAGKADQPAPKLTASALGFSPPLTTMLAMPAASRVMLCTTNYRLIVKTAAALAGLHSAGLSLAEAEGFQKDVFGDEIVSAIAPLDALTHAEALLLISTSGYARVFGGALIERLGQPVPYQTERIKGDPAAVIVLRAGWEVVVLTASGRALRLDAGELHNGVTGGRLMKVATDDRVIAAFCVRRGHTLLLAGHDGEIAGVKAGDLPRGEAGETGVKAFAKRALSAALPRPEARAVWAVGTHRLLPVNLDALRVGADLPAKPSVKVRIAKDEALVSLIAP